MRNDEKKKQKNEKSLNKEKNYKNEKKIEKMRNKITKNSSFN